MPFDIPLRDANIDVVYTSHSLEPKWGRKEKTIRELIRVAWRAVVLIEKESNEAVGSEPAWWCPLTHMPMSYLGDVFASTQSGLVYLVLRGIPMLRSEHGVVASKIIC